jgi:hypothetical protein
MGIILRDPPDPIEPEEAYKEVEKQIEYDRITISGVFNPEGNLLSWPKVYYVRKESPSRV